MTKGKLKVLRYETVLEMLEDGPVKIDEITENLTDRYPKRHVEDVLNKMLTKGYINWNNSQVWKTKELFYNEL